MADLSNQQINQSYPGLLTLQTSTTGITQNPQSLQDGLGNDTGFQIAENRLEGGNLFNVYKPNTPQYTGIGFNATALNPNAVQNQLVCNGFYDTGLYDYSAITLNCITLEAGTSVDVAFYNSQYLDTYGYVPYQKITEVNINTTSTGIKTASFSPSLSFSGMGGGLVWVVYRYNTSGTPVLRLANNPSLNVPFYMGWAMFASLGLVYNTAGTMAQSPFRLNSTSGNQLGFVLNTASFPSTMTSTQLDTIVSTNATQPGFILHTIR